MAMRGLTVFISDIRACRSREEEEKRVNKELANIRAKFKEGKMTSYDKKKYVCKLLYMYILGWDVDFGHIEALKLITGTKYTEKQIGYLAVTLLLTENSEMVRMVINSVRNDLTALNEVSNCLALTAIANVGGKEMAESLYLDVFKLLISDNSRNFVRKKAALCLLRLYKKSPDSMPVPDWADKIVPLLDDSDQGVLLALLSLVTALCQQYPAEYRGAYDKALNILQRILSNETNPDYEYYRVSNPWLQVKCLRLLQLYPPPPSGNTRGALERLIQTLVNRGQQQSDNSGKGLNHTNALTATILEAINLAIHLDPETEIVQRATHLLGSYISHKEANMRYLGLETMASLALAVESLDLIKRHTDTVLQALRDRDISIRRRALDLLFSMCDETNSRRIVAELLQYLNVADYAIREELVLKIAILAERFATDYSWYVDVILQLIAVAGDHVSEEVWYRVVQMVTNRADLQAYAARTVLRALQSPAWHETAVKVGGYILGEFGDYIANEPGCAPIDQFRALHSKFGACSLQTRALLLSTYVKFANLFPEIKQEVDAVFRNYANVLEVEVQQRALEYGMLSARPNLLEVVCEEMPPWEESKDGEGSGLLSIILKRSAANGAPSTTAAAAAAVAHRENKKRAQDRAKAAPLSNLSAAAAVSASSRPIVTAQPPPPITSAAAPPKNKTEDLLGLLNDTSSSATAPSAAGGGENVPSSAEAAYVKLLSEADGVLYEDDVLQVGVKSEYQAPRGRLALYFGNKSGSSPLNVSATLSHVPPSLRVQTQPAPPMISPQAQVQQLHLIICDAEFNESPLLQLTFAAANGSVPQRKVTLRLPIAFSKFTTGVTLSSDDFFARWKQIGGPPREAQRDFTISRPIDMANCRKLLAGLQLNVLDGVDANPANTVASGIFTSSAGKIGCLVRVQSNTAEQAFRVTVRTTNPTASEALLELIYKRLSL